MEMGELVCWLTYELSFLSSPANLNFNQVFVLWFCPTCWKIQWEKQSRSRVLCGMHMQAIFESICFLLQCLHVFHSCLIEVIPREIDVCLWQCVPSEFIVYVHLSTAKECNSLHHADGWACSGGTSCRLLFPEKYTKGRFLKSMTLALYLLVLGL